MKLTEQVSLHRVCDWFWKGAYSGPGKHQDHSRGETDPGRLVGPVLPRDPHMLLAAGAAFILQQGGPGDQADRGPEQQENLQVTAGGLAVMLTVILCYWSGDGSQFVIIVIILGARWKEMLDIS